MSSRSNCVSIVIRTFKRPNTLAKTLESISRLEDNYGKEVIVVLSKDDPTKDETLRIINDYAKHSGISIKIIEINTNSATKAWNEGIKSSECDYVMVMPDDVYLNKKTITRAMELLNNDRIVAVTYPAYPYGIDDVNKAPLNYKLHHLKFLNTVTTINTVLFVTVFRKDVLMKLGLYREDMGPPYTIHEDWELGSRIRGRGYKLIVDGTLRQIHLEDQATEQPINNRNSGNRQRRFLRSIIGYIRQYVNKHWWSMYQVLKVSPMSQRLEYIWYIVNPILLLLLLLLHEYTYAIILIIMTFTAVELINAIKGYFRVFGIVQRLIYPIITYIIRNVRAYLFLAGLIKNIKELIDDPGFIYAWSIIIHEKNEYEGQVNNH